MATFLELVNDVSRESGTISQSQELETVVGAAGRQRRIVGWTRQAWEIIQRQRSDWSFVRAPFTAALVPGETIYTGADLGIADFRRWLSPAERLSTFSLYDPTIGKGDEQRLVPISYREYDDRFSIGLHDANRPGQFAIGFDGALHVGPTPDKVYALRGWYRRGIQSLTADTDVPFVDPDHHQMIVWRALMLLGDDDEAPFEVTASTAEFRSMYASFVNAHTEPMSLA